MEDIASMSTDSLLLLLRQNAPLTDQQLTEVKFLLQNPGNEDDENTMEPLLIYAALAAPIRRLPVEILSQIFILCLSACLSLDVDRGPYVFQDVTVHRLRIGRVCSYWRCVARGTPAFWSHLWVTSRDPDFRFSIKLMKQRVKHVKYWSTLAGTYPLDLNGHFKSEFGGQSGAIDAFRLLLPNARTTCLLLDKFFPLKRLVEGQSPLSKLEVLEIFDRRYALISELDVAPVPLENFFVMPRLRSLTLPLKLVSCGAVIRSVPWGQLTKLELGNSGNEGKLDFLAQCVNLRELSLDNETARPFTVTSLIHLPSMQILRCYLRKPTLSSLATHLSFPNLRDVTFEAKDFPYSHTDPEFQVDMSSRLSDFFHRTRLGSAFHSAQLKLLSYHDIGTDSLSTVLSQMPHLRFLQCGDLESDAYRALINKDILPCLEELRLDLDPNQRPEHEYWDDLFEDPILQIIHDIVKSRRQQDFQTSVSNPTSQLQILWVRLGIVFPRELPRLEDRLAAHVKAGLRLRVFEYYDLDWWQLT